MRANLTVQLLDYLISMNLRSLYKGPYAVFSIHEAVGLNVR
jgi:hypothetical protein